MTAYLVFFLTVVGIYAIAVIGLNLQWGFTGLFNAGVAGFLAIGAYTFAILTGPSRPEVFGGFDQPFLVGIAGAVAMTMLCALLVGLATLKLREDYLAITTFGIAITIQLAALNSDYLTGGNLGLHGIPRPLQDLFTDNATYGVFYLGLVAATLALVYWGAEAIVRSPWGRVLKAIREDEVAARSLGKNVLRFRMEALMLGAGLMGLSGALYVGFISYVSPFDFQAIVTFQIWTMLILGGSGNNRGAILGALVVWAIWSLSGFAVSNLLPATWQARGGGIQSILIGLLLVLTLLYRPRGLIGEETTVSRHVTASPTPSATKERNA